MTTDPKDPALYDDDELTVAEYGVETGYGDLGLSSDPRILPMSMGLFWDPILVTWRKPTNRIMSFENDVTSVAHEAAQILVYWENTSGDWS